MRNWHWWQVLAIWIVAGLASGMMLRPYLTMFSASASNGGGLRSVGAPLWPVVALVVILIALFLVTWSWWRGQTRA